MQKSLIHLCLFSLISLLTTAQAQAFDTAAQYAIMTDYDTGTVLLAKEPDAQMHPSSMSKLMTLYVLFQTLKEGGIKLTDLLPVSEKAWNMEGSKTFVGVGDQVAVEDLIRGIIIQSGNDACVVVAEGLKGSEQEFVKVMNATGQRIGLQNSAFMNATGWPDDNHLMTARDLNTLAYRLIADFPEYYHYFAEQEFTYNGIVQHNRNRLLGSSLGVDGLKTGHTEAAGYGITLSAKDPQTNRRVILVINGLVDENARAEEGEKLLGYGLRSFTNKTLLKANEPLDNVPVWLGAQETVPVGVQKDLIVTLPTGEQTGMTFTLSTLSPVAPPIAQGAHIADLVVKAPGRENMVLPLVALQTVERASGISRLIGLLKYKVLGLK